MTCDEHDKAYIARLTEDAEKWHMDADRINWLREEIGRLHKMIERRDEEIHRLLGQIRHQAIYMTRD